MVQTDTDKMGLNLNLSMYSLAKPLSQFLDEVSRIKDNDSKLSEIDGYVGKLEEERKKIDVFKRELPLCMLLLNEAIQTLKEEASSVMMASNGKLDVGEGAKLESDNKKNWMSSAQLWISNSNSQLQSTNEEEDRCVTEKPIQTSPLSLRTPPSEILMDYRRIEQNHNQFNKPLQSHHIPKKEQRRRWSQDLHPLEGHKWQHQSRLEMMRVDGLTNDEVKSHLQKYRMHIRKHPLHPAKTLPSSDQAVLLDKETQSLISLTRSDSPQSPLVDRGLFSNNNGHSSEDEEKSDGRSWKSESDKKRQALNLEL
ncbi:hypothetical protein Bca52824_093262 [Brassica carinata]|uniref:HHO5-like N-terminal domain-containing protein n=1 Tax=Brassica carinata TaxID=52824 RepID=A0A8X7P683_BRACI|nr:hypothetical protein Bca52824_093262 [Brassica carinata]